MPRSTAIALALAFLPGIYAWFSGLRLGRKLDPPALGELNVARSRRLSAVSSLAIGPTLFLAPSLFGWLFALLLVGNLIGGFPLRKRLFGETWSLPAYLSHQARLVLVFLGSWGLLASAMAIFQGSGAFLPLVAVLVGVGVVGTYLAGPWLIPLLLGGGPLREPRLEPVFEPILAAARCPRPRLVRLPWGGRVTNAFALPSAGAQGTVAFTDGLLEALDEGQTAAILGHELAHLEHFDRRKVIGGAIRLGLAVVLAAAVAWLLSAVDIEDGFVAILWAGGVTCVLYFSLTARKKHEMESDLRALELGASAEDLIAGLTILHRRLALPRHWNQETEQTASHPSLGRRIQAIRRAAALDEPEPLEPIFLRQGTEGVIFEAHRMSWLGGLPAPSPGEEPQDPAAARHGAGTVVSLPYARIHSLTLVSGLKGITLTAIDEGGTKRTLAIPPEDLATVQETLSRVDHRLGGVTTDSTFFSPPARSPMRRWVAILSALVGLIPGIPWAVFLASVLVLVRPARTTLAAAATVCLGAAALIVTSPSVLGQALREFRPLLGILPLLLGFLYLGFLLPLMQDEHQRDQRRVGLKRTTVVLGAAALICLLGIAGSLGRPMIFTHGHLWARTTPTFALALLGIAAALWVAGTGRRWLVGLPLAPALFALFLTASKAEERFGEDPFRFRPAAAKATEVRLAPLRQLEAPGSPTGLLLSPGGGRVAVHSYATRTHSGRTHLARDSEDDLVPAFHVEQDDGSFFTLEAQVLKFVDEDRILVVQYDRGELALRLLPAQKPVQQPDQEPDQELWRFPLRNLTIESLSVAGNRWQVSGTLDSELIERDTGTLEAASDGPLVVSLEGEIGNDAVRTEEWPLPVSVASNADQWFAGSGLGLLSITSLWTEAGFYPFTLSSLMEDPRFDTQIEWWDLAMNAESERSLTDATYTTARPVAVLTPGSGDRDFFWSVAHGSESVLWRLRPHQTPVPVARFPSTATALERAGDGRILAESWTAPMVVDPEAGTVLRLLPPVSPHGESGASEETAFVHSVFAVAGNHAASGTSDWRAGTTLVRVFTLEAPGES